MVPAPTQPKPVAPAQNVWVVAPSQWVFLAALLIGVIGALWLGWRVQPSMISVPVLQHNLPAYTLIQAGDLTSQEHVVASLPSDVVRDPALLQGHLTREPLLANLPIREPQLGPAFDTSIVSGTVAFAIALAPSDWPIQGLRPGEHIDIVIVSSPSVTPTTVISFSNVPILDIVPNPSIGNNPTAGSSDHVTYVLAIPADQRDRFAIAASNGIVRFSRLVTP